MMFVNATGPKAVNGHNRTGEIRAQVVYRSYIDRYDSWDSRMDVLAKSIQRRLSVTWCWSPSAETRLERSLLPLVCADAAKECEILPRNAV